MTSKAQTVEAGSLSKQETYISIGIIGGLFFIFGFVSWVNAILIPYFKVACELNNFQSYLVAFAFYISYFVFSVPASYLLKAVGFKKGMSVGFWVMAVGAFVFVPAAMVRMYEAFLLGLFLIGAGLAVLQTAANPYITILGPKESAAQRISIMGILNKGAGILAPLIFAAVVLKVTDDEVISQLHLMDVYEKNLYLDELISRVILPYTLVGIVLAVLGILVRVSPLPEINTEKESDDVAISNANKTNIFQFPHLILGAVAIFLHVGTQVIAVDTIMSYAMSMGLTMLSAKVFPSYTLFGMICGYVFGIITIPRFIRQVNVFRAFALLGLVLTFGVIFIEREVSFLGKQVDISIWFVVLLGFANSQVWAGIWPLALDGLGKFTKLGASILVMGLCGNAILPMIYGYYADTIGLREAYWVLAPCYLYLIYYAVYGHKARTWSLSAK